MEKAKSLALTTDCWSDSHAQSFITLTAHLITNNWQMKTYNLDTAPFYERHTSENLLAYLKRQADLWRIDEKIKLVLSDNASNIVSALKSSGWKYMGCNAHKINLIVQDALKLPHIAELRAKVSYF